MTGRKLRPVIVYGNDFMNISIITVFPELHDVFIKTSIIGRAVAKGLVEFNIVRLSDMCCPKERIDEVTIGPGAGMIIRPIVIQRAIAACEERWGSGIKIFFSPQGIRLNQRKLAAIGNFFLDQWGQLSTEDKELQKKECIPTKKNHIILFCPRYEGIDARVEEHYADLTISIGDYVVMGGDLPAQVFLEGFLRLFPGIVGKQESVDQESFQTPFLDHPVYGLPVIWEEKSVPDVLRSGNHAEIERWRKGAAAQKTIKNRFDWFVCGQPKQEDIELAMQFIPPHYVALMHTDVNLKGGLVGTTSVASLDIHDTARACATYGVKNFFIVTPLIDQQNIIKTFLNFWKSEQGTKYNPSRQHAVSIVQMVNSFDDLIAAIKEREGVSPVVVATSAKDHAFGIKIDYHSQSEVWQDNRPVLFVFGTGQGLSDQILAKVDYLLVPLQGLPKYNHLSVRSAVSIILDRWLGLQPQLDVKDKTGKKSL
jgi:tRNA (guanine37-N1)-methyltransferase